MTRGLRIFLDANILFSAAKNDCPIRALFSRLLDGGHECWVDGYVIDEARRNITGPGCCAGAVAGRTPITDAAGLAFSGDNRGSHQGPAGKGSARARCRRGPLVRDSRHRRSHPFWKILRATLARRPHPFAAVALRTSICESLNASAGRAGWFAPSADHCRCPLAAVRSWRRSRVHGPCR